MNRSKRMGLLPSGICLYRSLGELLRPLFVVSPDESTADEPCSLLEPYVLREHWLFFLADGLRFPYRPLEGEALVSSPGHEDYRRVWRTLFPKLGLAYRYETGKITAPLIAAAYGKQALLLIIHVDALPYDASGSVRSNAFHCLRITGCSNDGIGYADDVVPLVEGGDTTYAGFMPMETVEQYGVGLLCVKRDGQPARFCCRELFCESLKRFLNGVVEQGCFYGAAALQRLVGDLEAGIKPSRLLDLSMVLKYQWYAAYRYLLAAAGDLGLTNGPQDGQLRELERLWQTVLTLLEMLIQGGEGAIARRLNGCFDELAHKLIGWIQQVLERASEQAFRSAQ